MDRGVHITRISASTSIEQDLEEVWLGLGKTPRTTIPELVADGEWRFSPYLRAASRMKPDRESKYPPYVQFATQQVSFSTILFDQALFPLCNSDTSRD